ncbi:MAG: GNAT family N-acetyltransferase [Propionibacteriaceae bacterium]|jgi:ribosomal-protein-alanine N-acetyltransferase|nr:GNAT family N-acetyltransferase [Propionibacteriaceae bacterium]
MQSSLGWRLANPSDLPAIVALDQAIFRPPWSATSWSDQLLRQATQVATVAERIVGVIAVSELHGTADLLRIMVDRDSRRRGIARQLVDWAGGWASQRGANQLLLEVSQHNESAQALYRSAGFQPLSRRRDYYALGDDALVWSLALPVGPQSSVDPVNLSSQEVPCPSL